MSVHGPLRPLSLSTPWLGMIQNFIVIFVCVVLLQVGFGKNSALIFHSLVFCDFPWCFLSKEIPWCFECFQLFSLFFLGFFFFQSRLQ